MADDANDKSDDAIKQDADEAPGADAPAVDTPESDSPEPEPSAAAGSDAEADEAADESADQPPDSGGAGAVEPDPEGSAPDDSAEGDSAAEDSSDEPAEAPARRRLSPAEASKLQRRKRSPAEVARERRRKSGKPEVTLADLEAQGFRHAGRLSSGDIEALIHKTVEALLGADGGELDEAGRAALVEQAAAVIDEALRRSARPSGTKLTPEQQADAGARERRAMRALRETRERMVKAEEEAAALREELLAAGEMIDDLAAEVGRLST